MDLCLDLSEQIGVFSGGGELSPLVEKQRNKALWAWVGDVHCLPPATTPTCITLPAFVQCSGPPRCLPALGFCSSQLSWQTPKS